MIPSRTWLVAIATALVACAAVVGCRKSDARPTTTTRPGRTNSDSSSQACTRPTTTSGPAVKACVATAQATTGQRPQPTTSEFSDEALPEPVHMGPKRLQGPCDSYLGEGLRALAKGENSLAAEAFYKAFETDPTRIDALKYMCEALLAEESYDQAVQIYEMLVEMDRHDHLSRFNLAVVYSRLKRFGEAEQVYAELLCERQDYVRARYNLAVLYQGQGKLSEAAKQWQEVIRQSPDLSSARACLGQVYLDLGQARRAMLQYAEAAKLRPKEAGAWTNLAEASKAAGFLGRAHVAMQRAVELSSEDAGLWRRLGQLQLQLHRSTGRRELLDCACESWQRSLSLDGNQQDVRDWLETYRTPRPATKPGK